MRQYEFAYRQHLPRRTYTLMRLDGRAFHTYLKDSDKPFDKDFVRDMDVVAQTLCMQIQGAQFAYTQSDEISLLLTDFQSLQSQAWFGGRVEKIISIAASLASAQLATLRIDHPGLPQFDCRVWPMSDQVEVANYFVSRQRDAVSNSIQMLAQHYYRPASLRGRSTDELQDILLRKQGVKWSELDDGLKRGRIVYQKASPEHVMPVSNKEIGTPWPNWLVSPAPHFVAEPGSWLASMIPPLPTLSG